jgi:protein SCO1/2
MRLRPVFCTLLLAALALSSCGRYAWRSGLLIDDPTPAPDVALTDAGGQPYRLADQRGAVVLLFFGFTNCPDVCPTTLADLAAARAQLGDDGRQVRVTLITVDRERDTPDRLARYVATFDPSFVALTGSEAQLAQVYQAFGVTAMRRELPGSALGYTIDHSASVYVVDQAGRWRALISNGAAVADIVSDLRYLVRSGGA